MALNLRGIRESGAAFEKSYTARNDRQQVHPVVLVHPESGRKALYINPIRTESIVGMPEAEALALLADLLEHATQPQYQYRHQWRPGDLVMWDNRSLLHKANGDYDMNQRRYLYRVMLEGDVPV